MIALTTRTLRTPVGPLLLVAHDESLVGLEFADIDRRVVLLRSLARHLGPITMREHKDPAGAATRLERYFARELAALDEQPCAPHGTPFQLEVWRALRAIPAGQTRSYSEQAKAIGRPAAVRAVGAANGANPIAVFVPCHRVVAADHTLWGYGGGLERKRWLLTHEGATFADTFAQGTLALAEGAGAARRA